MRLSFSVLILLTTVCCSFIINNIPYHPQINGVTCGDAILEMIIHFHKSDINQKCIMDVMRTTFEQGTLSYDIIRGGHFSNISSSFWDIYPEYSLQNGWFGNSVNDIYLNMGNAAFMYRSTECWIDKLKNILYEYHYPIGVLQYFDAQSADDGTHYRLVIGFNDTHIIMYDPWDSNGQPRTIYISNNEFCNKLWNYAETNGNVTYLPYFGAFIAPWNVSISYNALNINKSYDHTDSYYLVTVYVTYPCPDPFCDYNSNYNLNNYIALNTSIQLILPPMLLLDHDHYNNKTVTFIGDMKPNQTMSFNYYVKNNNTCDSRYDGNVYHISAVVKGFINGGVPDAYKGGVKQEYIQGYNYSDVIGGVGQVQY
eukprot:411610_1